MPPHDNWTLRDTCLTVIGVLGYTQLADEEIGFPHLFCFSAESLERRTFYSEPLRRAGRTGIFPPQIMSGDKAYGAKTLSTEDVDVHWSTRLHVGIDTAFSHSSPFEVQPATALPFAPNRGISHSHFPLRLHRSSVEIGFSL